MTEVSWRILGKRKQDAMNAFDPFVSFQGEHVRVLSQFQKDGDFYGCHHYIEVFRGGNILGQAVWAEAENWLPGYSEELILCAIENTIEYKTARHNFISRSPEADNKPLIVHVFGISSTLNGHE